MTKKPYLLLIRDGWGYNPDFKHNAVYHADTPNHDRYVKEYPTNLIIPSGENVGLPPQNMGSSEVGHLNMGAGRVVYQSLVRIDNSIEDETFYSNKPLIASMQHALDNNSNVHIWGLVQDQGVHAHTDHLIALLRLAKKMNLQKDKVIVHVISDGRDTPPQSTEVYVKYLEDAMNKIGCGVFGSISGRYFAMDRDTNWDRVKLAYDMLTEGTADSKHESIYEAVKDAYDKGENDEFIKPRTLPGFKTVNDNDSCIFFNYRLDRTRELTKAFTEDGFSHFETKDIKNLKYTCFTEYFDGVTDSKRAEVTVAFPPMSLDNLFGEYLAKNNLKQLRIAETEKFAHVTFFFNGQSDIVFENEDRVLVPSPKVATYDMQPEMSAYEVTDKAVEAVESDKYDVIVLNFANPDMVGHTGVYDAAVKACSVVDECCGKVIDKILEKDGVVFLTSDHGNAEQMKDYATGKPMTAHTNGPVWFSLISKRPELQKGKVCLKPAGGRLADVIPTMIDVMGMKKPETMAGESLIKYMK